MCVERGERPEAIDNLHLSDERGWWLVLIVGWSDGSMLVGGAKKEKNL